MGGKSSSPPATTTTIQKSELPAYVQPYAEQVMQRGAELSDQPYKQYGGQRYAGFTPEQTAGLSAITQRAAQGSPLTAGAGEHIQGVLSGSVKNPYSGSNPYLEDAISKATGDVRGKVMSQFGGSNYGTTANQEVLGRAIGDTTSAMRMQDYGNQQQLAESQLANQMRAATFAPQLAQQDYTDMQNLLGVGDIRRQYEQDLLNQSYSDWLAQQQHPYQQLDVLSNAIAGATGSGGTTTSSAPNPYQVNRTASMLGGGLAGGALGGMMGQQYAMPGAAAGGLLGLWGG